MKITPTVFLSCFVASWQFFYLARDEEGRWIIVGLFCDHFETILYEINKRNLDKKHENYQTSVVVFRFVLPRSSFVLPSQGWGRGGGRAGGPFWDKF